MEPHSVTIRSCQYRNRIYFINCYNQVWNYNGESWSNSHNTIEPVVYDSRSSMLFVIHDKLHILWADEGSNNILYHTTYSDV